MVKVPVGRKVKVNLWDRNKKRGIVKYYTDTMNLIRAESEFPLQKGDNALVVESYDNFCVVVPLDEYTQLIKDGSLDDLDYDGFSQVIYDILKDREHSTGGILSFEELYSIFQRSSIQAIFKKKHLRKILRHSYPTFEPIKYGGARYIALKPAEVTEDKIKVLDYAEHYDFVTKDMIQRDLNWSDVRIDRILIYLEKTDRIRIKDSYRGGTRYYFIQLPKRSF